MNITSKFSVLEYHTGASLVLDSYDDEDLLTVLNDYSRSVLDEAANLAAIEEEIESRELLIETPEVPFRERTDDWLGDRRGQIRTELSEISEFDKALRKERGAIDQEFMDRFAERGTSGTRTNHYTLTCKQDDAYPEVEDRTEFEEYILETGKIHLLQKRLSLAAIKEELSVMERERDDLLTELEDNKWDEETCISALRFLHEEKYKDVDDTVRNTLDDALQEKLTTLKLVKGFKTAVQEAIEEQYNIPGVMLTTKLTLNQVKRSK